MENRLLLSAAPSPVSHSSDPVEIDYTLTIPTASGKLVMRVNSFDLSVPGDDNNSANFQFTVRQSAASAKLTDAMDTNTTFVKAVLEATTGPGQAVVATWTMSNVTVESYTDQTATETIQLRCTRLAESTSVTTVDWDFPTHTLHAIPQPGLPFTAARTPKMSMALLGPSHFLFNAGVSDYTLSDNETNPGGVVDATLNFDAGSPNLLYALVKLRTVQSTVDLEVRNPNTELASLSWKLNGFVSSLGIEASAGKMPTEHFSFSFLSKISQTARPPSGPSRTTTMTASFDNGKMHAITNPETPVATAPDTAHYTLTVPGVQGRIPLTTFSWSVSALSPKQGLVSVSATSSIVTPALFAAALTKKVLKTAVVTFRDPVAKLITTWTMTDAVLSYRNRNGEDFIGLHYASIKRNIAQTH